jgi:hypothetical protein
MLERQIVCRPPSATSPESLSLHATINLFGKLLRALLHRSSSQTLEENGSSWKLMAETPNSMSNYQRRARSEKLWACLPRREKCILQQT